MDQESRCIDPSEELQNALVSYLYGECEPDERVRVDDHIRVCEHCAAELTSLRSVRGTLAAWAPPEPALGFRVVADSDPGGFRWHQMFAPSWGLAVAAALVLVVGAAIASVEMQYDAQGFRFRMGWSGPSAGLSSARAARAVTGQNVAPTTGQDDVRALWRADLANLENELRRDLAARDAGGVGEPGTSDEVTALLDQVRSLIAQSERRQQQEYALWLTEFAHEFDMQRRADQQSLQRELGALEGYTDYLVRTAGR